MKGLSRPIVRAIDDSKMVGIRAGTRSDHRFIGIWAVVVDGRVFARSWTQKADGWYRTLLADPLGTVQVFGSARRAYGASASGTPSSAPTRINTERRDRSSTFAASGRRSGARRRSNSGRDSGRILHACLPSAVRVIARPLSVRPCASVHGSRLCRIRRRLVSRRRRGPC